MLVYLSGSMTLVADRQSEHRTWAERAALRLRRAGVPVFSPYEHEFSGSGFMSRAEADAVVKHDLAALRKCDAMLLNASLPSWGASQELEKASEWGMYVVCLLANPDQPRSPWLWARVDEAHYDLDRAIEATIKHAKEA